MIKEIIKNNKMKYLLTIMGIIFFVVLAVGCKLHITRVANHNNKEVKQMMESLTYTKQQYNKEYEELSACIELPYLSAKVKGAMYKSLAELVYLQQDDLIYNEYASKAFFYLEKSKDYENLTAMNNEYIEVLYSNGGYEQMIKRLDYVDEMCEVDSLSNKKIIADFHMNYAEALMALGSTMQALEHMELANAAIEEMDEEDVYLQYEQAQLDLLYAQMAIDNEEINEIKKYVEKYSDEDDLGLSRARFDMMCNYRIPLYGVKAKYYLLVEDYQQAYECADEYIMLCSLYDFRMMQNDFVKYVLAHLPEDDQKRTIYFMQIREKIYKENMQDFSTEYTSMLLASFESSLSGLEGQEVLGQEKEDQVQHYAVFFAILLTAFLILYSIIQYGGMDGLTRLKNRRIYERERYRLERFKKSYVLLLLDIDDFKKINDTYGHMVGDQVLQRIGSIMKEHMDRGCCYRYGGEELCCIMKNWSIQSGIAAAEKIRRSIEEEDWGNEMKVTVSGGICRSAEGENPFSVADRYLYYSKKNGKNCITSYNNVKEM